MLKDLIKLASNLDRSGKLSEANKIDHLIKKYAQSMSDSQSPQAVSAPAISKSEARYQVQEKEGRYLLLVYLPYDQIAIGQFKISEFPSVIAEVVSGKRTVEGAKPGEKYMLDQFVIQPYGLVNGVPKGLQRERVIESSLTKNILSSLKNLPTKPPPNALSPDEQIIESGYQSYVRQFVGCATLAANANPNFGVVTDIIFTVNKDGATSNCSATSVPASPQFDACLVKKMNAWKFRELSAPTAVSYKQPFGRQK